MIYHVELTYDPSVDMVFCYARMLCDLVPAKQRSEFYQINEAYPTPQGMAFNITIEPKETK